VCPCLNHTGLDVVVLGGLCTCRTRNRIVMSRFVLAGCVYIHTRIVGFITREEKRNKEKRRARYLATSFLSACFS
jgi:hypothetical protein